MKNDKNLAFEAFWVKYPRKVGKQAAKKRFLKIKPEKYEKINDALDAYIKTKQWQDKQFIPHASTWLNQERYEDDVDDILAGEEDKRRVF